MSSRWIVPAVMIAALAGTPAIAQKFVYPAKGQSPEQQKKDEYECYTWAAQQSGYDPTKAPPPQAAAPSQPSVRYAGVGRAGNRRSSNKRNNSSRPRNSNPPRMRPDPRRMPKRGPHASRDVDTPSIKDLDESDAIEI
jgi:hypothetical protein